METHETQRDYRGLMRLLESSGDSLDSARLMETHETQGVCLGLMRLIILIKINFESCESERLMRLRETTVDS